MAEDIIAGRNSVTEALRSERSINKILVQDGAKGGSIGEIIAAAKAKNILIDYVKQEKLDKLVPGMRHQGIVAMVAPIAFQTLDDVFAKAAAKNEDPFILLLDELQDPQNVGALIRIADAAGVEAYIADPVVVDELQDMARVSGLKELPRRSIFHALNQKAIARRYAAEVGRPYEELNLVVVHMGGGISVSAHCQGRVIDTNNALDGDGPIAPERAGTLPAGDLVDLCFSGKYDKTEIKKLLAGKGGLVDHVNCNNVQELNEVRAANGDKEARFMLDTMSYSVAKWIGEMAVVLKGKVDAILLTGGIAWNDCVNEVIIDYCKFLAPIKIYPGENELESLAENALRVLKGETVAKEY